MFALSAPVLHVYTQCVVSLSGQGMDVLIPEPVLGVQVSETVLILLPASVELHRAVLPTLNHRPAAA